MKTISICRNYCRTHKRSLAALAQEPKRNACFNGLILDLWGSKVFLMKSSTMRTNYHSTYNRTTGAKTECLQNLRGKMIYAILNSAG